MRHSAPRIAAPDQGRCRSSIAHESNVRPPAAAGSGNQARLRRLMAGGQALRPKLTIGAVNDPLEREADSAADRVMRMIDPRISLASEAGLSRKRSSREGAQEEGMLRREAAEGVTGAAIAAPIVHDLPNSPGRPLDPATHEFMSTRFGHDFSAVRVHHDAPAASLARQIDARAFTIGSDIFFDSGEYAPGSNAGRRLLAHELAHVIQEGPAHGSIRRKPRDSSTDPLCQHYAFIADKSALEIEVDTLAATGDPEVRLNVIQKLKIFHRCADDAQIAEIKTLLTSKLGSAPADELWGSAGSAFGGYHGVYPGYYSGKKWLSGLGTSEVEATPTFPYPEPSIDPAIFDPRAEKIAPTMAKMIERADILYFYGHQYAQYGNPGAFANGNQDKFIDLRKLQGKGNFSRVKLLISTSCATICKEALDVFTALFPNAVILGYRKSAPEDGEAVRKSFDKAITDLKKPLLLNEPVDVAAIIAAWKSVVEKHHPKEDERLPGFHEGGTVHYLKNGKWESMSGADPGNSCRKKGTQIQQARHRGQP